MAGDARDLPLWEISSKSAYVVFSQDLGLISEEATASDAVHSLVNYVQRHPKSDAAIYHRSKDIWRIF